MIYELPACRQAGEVRFTNFMKQKYTKASLEALVQKAGVISRELDAKLERMEALAAKGEADVRECASWATRCAGHAVKCAECENSAGLYSDFAVKAAARKRNWTLWVDVPLCVLLVVDVVLRWV